MYCRINLSKTNYKELDSYKILDNTNYSEIFLIYKTYCAYKNFDSVTPLFIEDLTINETIGYYNDSKLVAFSLITLYKSKNSVSAIQFAWDYAHPSLRLGINSLKSECARYKRLGYSYLYLGEAHEYKKQIDGFEYVGKL